MSDDRFTPEQQAASQAPPKPKAQPAPRKYPLFPCRRYVDKRQGYVTAEEIAAFVKELEKR